MEKLGICGIELEWFCNYLNSINQFVSVNNENSLLNHINRGLPQGSILGPILFLIYINDIKYCTILFTLLFADDSSFLISGKNLDELVEILNFKLDLWFCCNEMMCIYLLSFNI